MRELDREDQFDREDLDRLTTLWQAGETNEAGRLLFQRVSEQDVPAWAGRALRAVIVRSGLNPAPFKRVLRASDHARRWRRGKAELNKIQAEVRNLHVAGADGLSGDQQVLAWMLSLAELVAKVTYNAAEPEDEFDFDSGWWIPVHLRWFTERWKDREFTESAWDLLFDSVSRS